MPGTVVQVSNVFTCLLEGLSVALLLTESLYRCALAAITGNHSLSIYVTGNDRKKFKQVCC